MESSKIDSLPFHNKDILPKYRRDRGLFVLMVVGIPVVVIWNFLVVLPQYHTSVDTVVIVHIVAALFIVFNIFGNMYFVKRIDASGKQKFLPSVLKPDWTYCHECNLNSPPRAYHCPICNECILKRDHHCMFAGCCVGYHNHRYYFVLVMYIWIGAVYAIIHQWEFCFEQMGGFGVKSVLSLIAPHFAWVFGVLSAFGFLVASIHIIGMVVIVMTSHLLLQQLVCIYKGQTQHERKQEISLYNLGPRRNFKAVFGNRWYLVWMSPWMKSSLQGDGLSFKRLCEIEEIKNI